MKIFNQHQIQSWDEHTIKERYQDSFELMCHASQQLTDQILKLCNEDVYHIVCGSGNNGGDGMVIAYYLHLQRKKVHVYLIQRDVYSAENVRAQERLKIHKIPIHTIEDVSIFQKMHLGVIVDCLLGLGINKPLSGLAKEIVAFINEVPLIKIAIDLPSGMMTEGITNGMAIKANFTLTIQCPKPSFFFVENSIWLGKWQVVEIGLSRDYYQKHNCDYHFVQYEDIQKIIKPRLDHSHKGNYGHALLWCGSKGMMGAALLSAAACMRSGVGKLTVACETEMQMLIYLNIPEAMVNDIHELEKNSSRFTALGMGCGLGNADQTRIGLLSLLNELKIPCVLDADALNIIAQQKLNTIPQGSIITPHVKEFDRLFGEHKNSHDRLLTQINEAKRLNIYIILKGKYTCSVSPEGKVHYNCTGNAGMATAGSGDVLTGLLTGLLAQGYSPESTCLLGVYLHGLAGDYAAKKQSMHGMKAGDIIDCLGEAFLSLE